MSQANNEVLQAFIAEKAPLLPGVLIFAKIWGSHSHNTALPTSDVDYLMVYACKPKQLLSLSPPTDTVDGKKPDFQAHEVAKFCSLLLKGNPGLIECLFTERFQHYGSAWEELRKERRRFLSWRTVKQYVGYAQGQLHKLRAGTSLHTAGGKFSEKWAYHLVRLLFDAERIAKGEDPLIWKEDGSEERSLLMSIREELIPQADIENLAAQAMKRIDALESSSGIPKEGDKEFLNEWLLDIRGL